MARGARGARDHHDQGGAATRAARGSGRDLRGWFLPARLELEPTLLQGHPLVAPVETVGPNHLQPRDGQVLEHTIEELLDR